MRLVVELLIVVYCLAFIQLDVCAQTVKTGIDNLLDTHFELLDGKRIVLVSHAAARARTGRTTADELLRAGNVTVIRILAPEHGFHGVERAGEFVADDTTSPLPIISLYGSLRRPSANLIMDADVVVLDLQDIGCRSYTYLSTMVEVMEACAEHGVSLMILDRPNPLGGQIVDGRVPDPGVRSFVCRLPVPYVHGMTLGELATMVNAKGWLSPGADGKPRTCSLLVVRCKGWKREMTWEDTQLNWYPTSPNIPTVAAARCYPITGILGELGLCSIGIGSGMPFCVVGSPTFVADTILEQRMLRYGVNMMYGRFVPTTGMYAGTTCSGYHIAPARGTTFMPFTAALALVSRLFARREDSGNSPRSIENPMFSKVTGSEKFLAMLNAGAAWPNIEKECSIGVQQFRTDREQYLLYGR